MRVKNTVRIVGVGMTPLNPKPALPSLTLMINALNEALADAGLRVADLDGIIAVPSLAGPNHFMQAHAVATAIGLLPRKQVVARTLDTGGAGPVTGLLEARRMIQVEGCNAVAVVAGDAISSLTREQFLSLADSACQKPAPHPPLPSPVIPHGYDIVAQWQMKRFGLTRRQLAMCASLMSFQASRHPHALTKKPVLVDQVLQSAPIAPVTSKMECARRADGGAALIVSTSEFMTKNFIPLRQSVVIVGGGEASGPLWPPDHPDAVTESMFSCEEAADAAYTEAQLGSADIDFFGLYDCFPICLVRAVEAVGLAPRGGGGMYIERMYNLLVNPDTRVLEDGSGGKVPPQKGDRDAKREGEAEGEKVTSPMLPQEIFPVNTHGGLLAFGAPWEAPAMYNIIEAVMQLRGQAGARQIPQARRALVYGNGGIFSSSAVAILGTGEYGSRAKGGPQAPRVGLAAGVASNMSRL